jgi:hypothetical protein
VPGRKVCVARIAAANVRAERATQAVRIRAIGERVHVAGSAAAFDPFVAGLDERSTVAPASHHRACDPLAHLGVAASLAVDEVPEAVDVLAQLAQDEVAAIATEVGTIGRILGARQSCPGACRIEQRPVGVAAILVRIAEQVLPRQLRFE